MLSCYLQNEEFIFYIVLYITKNVYVYKVFVLYVYELYDWCLVYLFKSKYFYPR